MQLPQHLRQSKDQTSQIIQRLENSLPPVFSRQEAVKQLGNLISSKTLANLDARGQGPTQKLHIGRKVAYEKNNFLEWLKERIKH